MEVLSLNAKSVTVGLDEQCSSQANSKPSVPSTEDSLCLWFVLRRADGYFCLNVAYYANF